MTADLVFLNANVFTNDAVYPRAEALAISGNSLLQVGSNSEVRALIGPGTRHIDAQQGTIIPGIIDSHFHLLLGALLLNDLLLEDVASLDQLTQRVREYAIEADDWIVGHQLAYGIIGASGSARLELDRIESERPVIIFSYDDHSAWANTKALTLAGILNGAKTPANSEIVMADDGLAQGELREPGAYNYIKDLFPILDQETKRKLLHRAQALAASFGITSIHNMDGDPEQIALYQSMLEASELKLRIYCPITIRPEMDLAAIEETAQLARQHQHSYLRMGFVKFFLDGVIETGTAFLVDDYADLPSLRGQTNFELAQFESLVKAADRLGLQVAVHAIGDAAVKASLNAFETARKINGTRDSRHRIEHIELIQPEDLKRFKELGVIASMQPFHAPTKSHDVWGRRVGPKRWELSFPWRALLNHGATLVFGSDWPIVSQNPALGLHSAVTRTSSPSEFKALSLTEALQGYFSGAYVEFREREKGSLSAGKVADLVLYPQDLFKFPTSDLPNLKPALTLLDGKIIYEG